MNKLLVISSYPSKGEIHHSKTVGIASYAKNTLLGIKGNEKDMDILILAEKLLNEDYRYEDEGIKIKRAWKRESLLSFPLLILEVLKNTSYKHILLEFEVSMFGNPFHTAPLPLFNFALRLLRKKIVIVIHQTITDLGDFEGHVNIKGGSFKTSLMNICLNIFYFLLLKSGNTVVVFEDSLKEKLSSSNSKIVVIPHGVQAFNATISKEDARKKLKIGKEKKIVLLFGYVAWYKGTDWVVDEFRRLQKNPDFKDFILVVGGGPNPNHIKKEFYMNYVDNVIRSSRIENIMYTGFITEVNIPIYFNAADFAILPYRAFMSASGPLSIAYSFGKPTFISSPLKGILETRDIRRFIRQLKINKKDLIFKLENKSFEAILKRVMDEDLSKNSSLSKKLKQERDFKKIGKIYINTIFN